jgi:hypothetical protein
MKLKDITTHLEDKELGFFQRIPYILSYIYHYVFGGYSEQTWKDLGHRIVFALRMIWKHGVIIVLMIIPVVLLVVMPQGKDLLYNMLFDNSISIGTQYLRVLWFVVMIVFTSYALWAIPEFYLKHEGVIDIASPDKNKTKETSDKEDKTPPSTSSLFLRILSATPFIFYGIVLFFIEPRCTTSIFLYYGLIIFLGLFVMLLCVHLYYSTISVTYLMLAGSFFALVLPTAYLLTLRYFDSKEMALLVLGNNLLLLGGMVYVILLKWENKFPKPSKKDNESIVPDHIKILQKRGRNFYMIVFVLFSFIMLLFSLISNMLYVTSVSLMTMVMGCLILWFNLISYYYKTLEGWKQLAFFGGILGVIVYLSIPASKPHSVVLVDKSEIDSLPSLDNYMKVWFDERDKLFEKGDSTPMPVFLVAGEGGGSRAGLWYTTFFMEMDSLTDGYFSKNTFAMSTISGSSVGASLLAKWYRVSRDLGLDRTNDKRADSLAYHFFSNNFVSGSLFDLFFLDLVRRFNWEPTRSGRNLRLQKEENEAFIRAMEGRSAMARDMLWPPLTGPSKKTIKIDVNEVANYHFLPIQDLYFDVNKKLITDIPLCFFNTTHMATGRQYTVAPVSFTLEPHMDSLDNLITHVKTKNKNIKEKYDIALGTASNLSELFPFFSAYANVDNVGMFMDGGGSDNSGTKTLTFLFHKLQEYISKRANGDIKYTERYPIVVIYVSNGNADDPEDIAARTEAKNQLMSMLGQAFSQPFNAITPEAIQQLKKQVLIHNQTYEEASWSSYNKYYDCPKSCKDSLQVIFPTARSLESNNLRNIILYSKMKANEVFDSLKVKFDILKNKTSTYRKTG